MQSDVKPFPLVQFIGGDPDKDIAVLQLQAPEEKLAELKPISIGTSTNLQVGQKVGQQKSPTRALQHALPLCLDTQHAQLSLLLSGRESSLAGHWEQSVEAERCLLCRCMQLETHLGLITPSRR